MEFMGLYVLPKMKALFQEHDAKQFKDFKCQTCHGDDMEAVDFKMPNALYALPAANTLEAAKDYDAKITDFMVATVMPSMAELLGAEPLNPQTGQGFSCFNCHQKE
jgi:cytochrome c553